MHTKITGVTIEGIQLFSMGIMFINCTFINLPSNYISYNCEFIDCEFIDKETDVKPNSAWTNQYYIDECVPFAPLPEATCQPPQAKAAWPFPAKKAVKKEEGKTPMRYNDNTAIASVTVQKSDAAVQREYFLSRLNDAAWPKRAEMEKTFKLHVTPGPQTFEDLIDMIKNDKFKINKKAQTKLDEYKETGEEYRWYSGPMYGIEWDGPKADIKGYEQAINDMDKAQTLARDTIMSGDAAAMAKAVADFEAWTPTGAAN